MLAGVRPAAATAIFDFDDFPSLGHAPTDPDAPYTYDYQCDGKDYCTQLEVHLLRDLGNGSGLSLSTVRDGIQGTFRRGGAGIAIWGGLNFTLDRGNTSPGDLALFEASFDTALDYVQVDLLGIRASDDYELLVELWSGEALTGGLIGSVVSPCSATACEDTLSIQLIDQAFRSMRFGMAWAGDPDCVWPDCGEGEQGWADNIVVHAAPVPEPGTALLFLVASGIAGLAERRYSEPSASRA